MPLKSSAHGFSPDIRTLAAVGTSISAMLMLFLVDLIYPLPAQANAVTCFALVAILTFKTWQNTSGGNHPIFLLMIFLGLFQFGQIVSWMLFGNWTIDTFSLAVATPFQIEDAVLKKSMLLVPLSATFIYLGFFWSRTEKSLTFSSNEQMRTFFGWMFLLTIPFVLIKDISYLNYALKNGGYIATYLGGGEHLQQVGLTIRGLALLNTLAFLPYLVVEDRPAKIFLAASLYMLVLTLELLIGFRGKFFINLMFIWMLMNIKRGSSFKPVTALIGSLALAALAIAAAMFRESQEGPDINLFEHFLKTQGVSFYVTVSSVLYYDVFQQNALPYLYNQFLLPYAHISKFHDNSLLTLDLTAFLNPDIVNYALGTGDAYLANLYLLWGTPAVVIGSLGIGLFCAWLNSARTVYWRTIALSIFLWIPYLPRSGLLEPIGNGTKYLVTASAAFGLFMLFTQLSENLGLRSARPIASHD